MKQFAILKRVKRSDDPCATYFYCWKGTDSFEYMIDWMEHLMDKSLKEYLKENAEILNEEQVQGYLDGTEEKKVYDTKYLVIEL